MNQEFIINELGFVLSEMGYKICNSQRWQEELLEKGISAPSEEAILAKKAELDAAKSQAVAVKSAYEQAINLGFTIPNTEIVMSVSPKSVTTLNNYATHLDRKFQAGDIDANTLIDIVDKDDGKHKISYQDFIDMLIPLGDRALVVDFIGRSSGVV